jgi:hypothetical protein
MQNRIIRKKQLVRLRGSEHRMAQARLAQAQSDLARLNDLSDRLSRLRRELAVSEREAAGNELRMMGEMSARLDLARAALEQPIQAAAEQMDQRSRDTGMAAARKDAAAQLLDRETRQAAQDAELRRDAAHIHTPGRMRLRVVSGGVA